MSRKRVPPQKKPGYSHSFCTTERGGQINSSMLFKSFPSVCRLFSFCYLLVLRDFRSSLSRGRVILSCNNSHGSIFLRAQRIILTIQLIDSVRNGTDPVAESLRIVALNQICGREHWIISTELVRILILQLVPTFSYSKQHHASPLPLLRIHNRACPPLLG